MNPTILEITQVDLEDDSIDYRIIDNHSGGYYDAYLEDVLTGITEDEEYG